MGNSGAPGAEFEARFGAPATHGARAPGRVNLIGEHVDYEGYAVLPMAVALETWVCVRRAPAGAGAGVLVVANADGALYPEVELPADPGAPVDRERHSWANYFQSGYKGVFEHLRREGRPTPEPCGLQVMVRGRVPAGSGLSSSSALVVASAAAVAAVHGLEFSRQEIAEFTRVCEQHVGTMSGGMDQAISVMGERGLAKLIEFGPVRASDVVLPPGCAFVIANSLTVSKKAETAAGRYNLRVLECRLAAVLLAAALGTPLEVAVADVRVLKDVEAALVAAGKSVGDLLHEAPYSQEELEGLLGASIEAVAGADFLPSVRAAAELGGFKLRQRAEHVYSEAQRVLRFRDLCNSSASASAAAGETLAALGKMMDESHASCSVQYECSSPELEELTGMARELGALGARLTGAGWGGCMVALVKEADVGPYIQALKDRFFQKHVASGELDATDLDSVVFASGPCPGASWGRMATAGALEN